MNIQKQYIPLILCLAFASGIIAGCGRHVKETQTAKAPVSVTAMKVSMTGSAASKTYIGTVHPAKSAVLASAHSGTLAELKVRQGQAVNKGEVIAVINSQRAASSLEMASAALRQAKDGYDRAKAVHESGSIAEVKMVEVETQLRQAEAAYKAAAKAYSDCAVKAPYSGVIGEVYIESGVEVSVAQPVARIMDISSVEIHFPVPEGEINSINTGEEVWINVPALGEDNIAAHLTAKGVAASALSHSYDCTAVPFSSVTGLMPGMVCKVSLAGNGAQAAVIPASVIKTDVSGRYVWAVRDGRAVKVPVVTGGFSGRGVIISEGLEDGDYVIVDGAGKVSSGMKVKIVE